MSYLSASQLAEWFSSQYSAFGGRPSGVIFDCDGVLIDSREANIAYYDYLRSYVGLPPLPKEQPLQNRLKGHSPISTDSHGY